MLSVSKDDCDGCSFLSQDADLDLITRSCTACLGQTYLRERTNFSYRSGSIPLSELSPYRGNSPMASSRRFPPANSVAPQVPRQCKS